MRLTNGTDTVNLTNQIQIRAYLTSGYYVADGEPTADELEETAETVEETKKPTADEPEETAETVEETKKPTRRKKED
jgi:hypothetical protein